VPIARDGAGLRAKCRLHIAPGKSPRGDERDQQACDDRHCRREHEDAPVERHIADARQIDGCGLNEQAQRHRRDPEAERAACNLRSQTFMTDTRTLRFYYRLLKDNRLQIGSRSSVTGAEAADPVHEKLLTDAIARKSHLGFVL